MKTIEVTRRQNALALPFTILVDHIVGVGPSGSSGSNSVIYTHGHCFWVTETHQEVLDKVRAAQGL